ncbi:MAG: hypothetical protein WBK91_05495 [Alphaproteobacteria bacterium]
MNATSTVTVYVQLLEEGTDTIRPTQAMPLGGDLYKLLPTPNYDPEDEIWEFVPGSVVRCKRCNTATVKDILYAIEKVG